MIHLARSKQPPPTPANLGSQYREQKRLWMRILADRLGLSEAEATRTYGSHFDRIWTEKGGCIG